MLGESFVPMVDFQIHLSYFDLSSGQGKTIFRGIPSSTTIQPLGVHRGLPYFAQYGQLTTIDVDTCAARAAVQNRIFDGVSAFAADDHAIYWAETYTDLSVSRVFMKKDDSSAVLQVVEASGEVTWLGADATHLYWAEAQGDAPRRYYIFRVALPK